ncbi:transketolase [Oceanotoga sp. DSM 15011]|uniref:transketolase n=1 Tax=Oceanotoga sp. DSM 15011 TaxID=2984951 RepID=UPI0021F48487|nr:transketolase [Oceanotoga sp. DSM 15011]UYO98972.1 transketolase [Oceanotoga sp. DSM 15011]
MLNKVANIVRGLTADAVQKAGSGHPGMPLGCAEIGAVLFSGIIKNTNENDKWINRDRFVLSAGHGSMLLYSYLYLNGYISLEDIKNFKQLDSITPGHPEYGVTPGVDCSTGPLGQGFSNAVGMAIAEKMLAERYNTEKHKIIDHYTYTIVGDGCLMEGISTEAASIAGHLGLEKLIVIYDSNKITIEGNTDIAFTENIAKKFESLNWNVIENIDGHDIKQIEKAINDAKIQKEKPTIIIAKTNIAKYAPTKQDTKEAHGSPLGEDEIIGLKRNLNIPENEKFYITEDVLEYFKKVQKEQKDNYIKWEKTFEEWSKENPKKLKNFEQGLNLSFDENLIENIINKKQKNPIATRKASGEILNIISEDLDYLIGGSADLGPSTNTVINNSNYINKDDFSQKNIHFGIREHAMGAIVNGIALHGGFRVFCSTYLVFSDYMRNPIRMAALMNLPVIFIYTHDSIYVGGDGPTHEPVEQIESLRLIPNLNVIRPADSDEVKTAWLRVLKETNKPTVLIMSRQDLNYNEKNTDFKDSIKGGYIVKKMKNPKIVLIGSGSEVNLCYKISEKLLNKGIENNIVSIPDREKFLNQNEEYINQILPQDIDRIVLEAGRVDAWYKLKNNNNFIAIGVDRFGLSGDGDELAKRYGFDIDKIINQIK